MLVGFPSNICRCAELFFSRLYSSEQHQLDHELEEFIPHLVNDEDNSFLIALPHMEELKGVVFSLSANSAPGPDGFSGHFYRTTWDIIKQDLMSAVVFFLSGGIVPRSMNTTLLTLIPKKTNPTDFSEYRPISLCNFLYKVLTYQDPVK